VVLQHALVDQLRINAEFFPSRPALSVIDGPALTYDEAWRRTCGLARALADVPERGELRPVGLLLPNGLDAALAYLACQLAGCVAVPINGRLARPEMEYIVGDSRAGTLLTSAPFLDTAAALSSPEPLSVIDCAGIPTPGTGDMKPSGVDGSKPMLIGYTSGTTGFPKGALFSHDTMHLWYMRWGWQYGLTEQHTVMTTGPMFHNSYGGLSILALVAGAHNRIMATYDDGVACTELAERATWTMLVPAMMASVLAEWRRRGSPPLESLRFLLSSGAPVTAPLLASALEAFPNATIAEAYGWSEGGWVTFEVKSLETLRPQCVGWPMTGLELRVQREDGTPCARGERGEIAVRNVTPFMGYLNKPEATAATVTPDGFTLSGDIGAIGDDGRVYIVDRKKDLIVTGGENVASVEVERVLAEHPRVIEAAVIGRPDERWGEAVTAVVVPAADDVTEEEVRAFCRERLAGFKVPKRVEFTTELPRNSMGKLQKYRLREEAPMLAGDRTTS
jgi:acyl-CoA synthetase (AMP-forming)/AMP-acid ligase II